MDSPFRFARLLHLCALVGFMERDSVLVPARRSSPLLSFPSTPPSPLSLSLFLYVYLAF